MYIYSSRGFYQKCFYKKKYKSTHSCCNEQRLKLQDFTILPVMCRASRSAWATSRANPFTSTYGLWRLPRVVSSYSLHQTYASTKTSMQITQLQASQATCSTQPQHVQIAAERLASTGILKINLDFPDDDSQYLKQLVLNLHKYHGHMLPITHSASRGWFWDIRPSAANFQTANCQARSETMEEFPWHTDCSYENPTPRYFALQVLRPDRYGGGVLSLMNVQGLSERLSSTTRVALMRPDYKITTPMEFYKQSKQHHITGNLFATDSDGRPSMRFRGDIVTALNSNASQALEDLKQCLTAAAAEPEITMHLSAVDLPERTIVLVDNRRWLHARTDVKDPERHLRRIRWGAVPFPSISP
ncbi:hypothetical protein F5Y12DRAFT_750783 [Xylaria sp. FL1777]|nr:hypothetical protein F5Y12DRAFT_750783 [Xylaria sp. FL1777]